MVRELAAATAVAGLLGILSSAKIYLVPARPAWNRWWTPAEFFGTAVLLGPALAGSLAVIPYAAAVLILVQAHKALAAAGSEELELQQTSQLLRSELKWLVRMRIGLLALTMATPLLPLALAAEAIGRYLFFVSVVPRNIAATFFGTARDAA
jgi:DMSO reductase anchor subunit